jgi:hypothetical protein
VNLVENKILYIIMLDEDNELAELKELYDELWNDGRTMIKDMNRSIYVYLFAVS